MQREQQKTAAAAKNPPTDRTEPADRDADGNDTQTRPTTLKQQVASTPAPDPPNADTQNQKQKSTTEEAEAADDSGSSQPAQTARGPEAARPDRTGLKTPARHTSERWRDLRHGPRGANFADGSTRLIRGPAGAPSPFLSFFLSFFQVVL